ncbi:MAG: hypothetical protein HUK08_04280 [Bacteroidaceae bacterium]|nr:hypothetical protein [Bacteroidaceae bacterium]
MMKFVFSLVLALCFCGSVNAQTIQDRNFSTVGYAQDGRIQNGSYSTIANIESDGTVKDGSYCIIGYIKSDGTVQNRSFSTIGHIRSDGTVQDGSYCTLGYVKSDGTVQDRSFSIVGYARGVKVNYAALFFFFLQKMKS